MSSSSLSSLSAASLGSSRGSSTSFPYSGGPLASASDSSVSSIVSASSPSFLRYAVVLMPDDRFDQYAATLIKSNEELQKLLASKDFIKPADGASSVRIFQHIPVVIKEPNERAPSEDRIFYAKNRINSMELVGKYLDLIGAKHLILPKAVQLKVDMILEQKLKMNTNRHRNRVLYGDNPKAFDNVVIEMVRLAQYFGFVDMQIDFFYFGQGEQRIRYDNFALDLITEQDGTKKGLIILADVEGAVEATGTIKYGDRYLNNDLQDRLLRLVDFFPLHSDLIKEEASRLGYFEQIKKAAEGMKIDSEALTLKRNERLGRKKQISTTNIFGLEKQEKDDKEKRISKAENRELLNLAAFDDEYKKLKRQLTAQHILDELQNVARQSKKFLLNCTDFEGFLTRKKIVDPVELLTITEKEHQKLELAILHQLVFEMNLGNHNQFKEREVSLTNAKKIDFASNFLKKDRIESGKIIAKEFLDTIIGYINFSILQRSIGFYDKIMSINFKKVHILDPFDFSHPLYQELRNKLCDPQWLTYIKSCFKNNSIQFPKLSKNQLLELRTVPLQWGQGASSKGYYDIMLRKIMDLVERGLLKDVEGSGKSRNYYILQNYKVIMDGVLRLTMKTLEEMGIVYKYDDGNSLCSIMRY